MLANVINFINHGRYIFVFLIFSCNVVSRSDANIRGEKPNILFITVDDLRPQLGVYGKKYMVTPHMDQLAREGRLFANHYVTVPTCGPSRYALLTGQYPRKLSELRNSVFETSMAGQPIGDKPESMVETFRRNGYYTVGIGKISHSADGFVYGYNDPISTVQELPNSWDEFHFDAGKWATGWNAFFGYANGENRQSLDRQVKPYELGASGDTSYVDGLTAELAVKQIKELKNMDDPFFLAVGFFKPHLPFNAPQKYWDLYDTETLPLTNSHNIPGNTHKASLHESGEFNGYLNGEEKAGLDHELTPSYARTVRHGYFAAVSYVDAQVGKVLNALEENGLSDNTIIVLWGDHGWHLGDHRVWGKHTLSEYALRSALVVMTPGMNNPGMSSNSIVESTDIYPTLLDLTDQEIPSYLEGESFMNVLNDPSSNTDGMAFSYFRQGISLRTPRYRLTKYFRDQQPVIELYDYDTDLFETKNIAKDHPDLVNSLLVKWEQGITGIYQ